MRRWLVADTRSATNHFRKLPYQSIHEKSTDGGLMNVERKPMFSKILIANRGEIACRVMRTAKALGIKTVAVYSEPDRYAQHTKLADEAYCIGPAPSTDSYLRMDRILEVAKKSGAQAIHPGYGFLSENAEFAKVIEEFPGLTFVGPPPQAMISMGSKSESKEIMEAAGVPVVPGYHGSNQEPEFLLTKAAEIGYPVLIKAIKGGGGKGMRIVKSPEEFFDLLESSKREARKSFGDDKVLIEKYLARPRHVEVQVFADTFGSVVHLFERDCSVQRRHQKILEEAPAPGLPDSVRADLGAKAVAAARAVGYVGAGTVEFIFDTDTNQFYFMEMNTRLQVEHPVTEMVTGVDLVQWQLEVASGNPLPLTQSEIQLKGHSFEARIYAENPRKGFLPDVGPLRFLSTPNPTDHIRVETGVIQGDQVSVHYDPMIAKLVCHGATRYEALRVLQTALAEYRIAGLSTNLDFLTSVAKHPAFQKGDVETGFIQKYEAELFPERDLVAPEILARAALRLILADKSNSSHSIASHQDPNSPWGQSDSFRLNLPSTQSFQFTDLNDSEPITVITSYCNNSYHFTINYPKFNQSVSINDVFLLDGSSADNNLVVAEIKGHRLASPVVLHSKSNGQCVIVQFTQQGQITLTTPLPSHIGLSEAGSLGSVRAPMPCKITQVLVKAGDSVASGQPLVVLEAMKMEHVIKAPKAGKIAKIPFSTVGQLVPDNAELVIFESES